LSYALNVNTILSPVKKDLALFDRKLQENLGSDSTLISQVAGHLVNRRGKRLRPAMVFLSYGLCANSRSRSASDSKVMNVALAIECIHTATLLHDDVIDQSKVRRGQVSVNHKWNNLVSVLMGDFLLAKSLRLIVQTKSPALLSTISQATENLSIGEMNEVQESHNFDLDEETYLRIISEKTSSLFTASCESGAVAAGAGSSLRMKLKEYGENLGIAFQITDDLLDWVGETHPQRVRPRFQEEDYEASGKRLQSRRLPEDSVYDKGKRRHGVCPKKSCGFRPESISLSFRHKGLQIQKSF
jgi:octaprenyl-diphosphate synthase